jgi:hydrogenase-4 membrane subunit HyfE
MSERAKQPWTILIITLITSLIAWLIVLSGAFEGTSAPRNFILALAKIYAIASTIGLLFLLLLRLWSHKS